jgi:hypothetical protein
MVVRKNVLEYIIALVVVKNKVRLKKCLNKFQISSSAMTLIMYILRSIGTDPGFQVRRVHLKKLRRAEGGAKIVGVFRFYAKQSYFFPILGKLYEGDEKMNYEKLQFEREIIDVVRSSYI